MTIGLNITIWVGEAPTGETQGTYFKISIVKMNSLAINAVGDELEASAKFCSLESIGIEVTDFAFPKNLDGELNEIIDRHIEAVTGISPVISHGPFFDLNVISPDPAIVEICRKRHLVSLGAAHRIGASIYVAHTNYNPNIKNPWYRKKFVPRTIDFWLPFADMAGRLNMKICLENLWEPGPEMQAEIIVKADHPNLRASFDNGHALIFSEIPAKRWIEILGRSLLHCHLHDNGGEVDEHKSIGDGKENWPELLNAIDTWSPEAIIVAESDRLDRNKISIERLRSF